MKYQIWIKEIHHQLVEIEADSPNEAIDKVIDGDGDYITSEYDSTDLPEDWSIYLDDKEIPNPKKEQKNV